MTALVPSIPIGTLKSRMGSRSQAERVPLWAHVEIIATCNFSCKHCYIAPCAEREDVMSLADAEILFGKLQRAGTLQVLLTGGEIFTHKQFKEIYLSAKRHGFLVYLNTNGYLLGERWAKFFAEHPPHFVSISLYGLSNKRYEEVTGIPNSFDRVVQALDHLARLGIRHEVKCPAMSLTIDEIPAMKAWAAARGLSFRFDAIITPADDRSMRPVDYQLSPEAILELDQTLDPGLEGRKEFFASYGRPPADNKVYKCGAGRTSMHVNVHGGVSTCVTSRQTVGNLFEQPFEEVWGALGGKVEKRFADGHPCATCKFRSMCAGCPATVEQMTGLPDGYVQQYCKITHLRAQAMGVHATGVPRTVTEGIPHGIAVPQRATRALPVLN